MPVACRQPTRDQVPLALQIDDADIAALTNQDIAIGAFESRAGDGAMIPNAPGRVDPGGNPVQPRPAVLICQRLAGACRSSLAGKTATVGAGAPKTRVWTPVWSVFTI
jgi:hypothetical protein